MVGVKNEKSGGGNNGVVGVIKKTVVGVMEWVKKKTTIVSGVRKFHRKTFENQVNCI